MKTITWWDELPPGTRVTGATWVASWIENDDPGDEDPSSPPNRVAILHLNLTAPGRINNVILAGVVSV